MVSAGYLHIFDRFDRLFLRIDHLHIFYPKLSQLISHNSCKGTDLGFVNIRHTECGGVKLVACAHCGYYGDICGFCPFDYFKLARHRVDGVDNIIVLGKVEPVCRFGHIKALVGIHPDIGADVVDTLFGGIDLIFSHGAAEGVYLAVKVCEAYPVVVDKVKSAHAASCKSFNGISANAADAEYRNSAAAYALHCLLAEKKLRS